ncbi:hypothetical protein HF290_00980 [Acidithiobacillus ferrooxidans]|uniref:hypothetical protein n=1 Tax=Acidithiobacillus ferrooxidans TaxID=920 RepID=UPI001C077B4F|nr:hypothetical protein [Acidithiobacillus ferrooxidans]MBU2859044.1 hypothetical protein [Acidithiobacillus ferrooxidans]
MKRMIIFSHGDKGGVGKSVVAALLVDMALQRFGKASLIEGDTTTPDVYGRYSDYDMVLSAALPLNLAGDASTAIANLAGWLENSNQKDHAVTVVNLPANASETLDGLADLLIPVCEDLDYEVAACYSIGKGADAANSLKRSLEDGFLSRLDPERRMVVVPEFFGAMNSFVWFTRPDAGAYRYLQTVVPKLEPTPVADLIFKTGGAFSDMECHKPDGFGVYHTHALRRWLQASHAALAPIFPASEPGSCGVGEQGEEEGGHHDDV